MSNDKYTHTQCLLLIVNDGCQNGGKQLRSSARRAEGRNASTASSVKKAFALLPAAFINGHPKLMAMFRQIDIHPVDRRNVSRLLVAEDKLQVIEILLEDDPSASVDSLIVIVDTINVSIVNLSFQSIFFRRKVETASIVVRPAVDNENLKTVKRLLVHRANIWHRYRKKIGILNRLNIGKIYSSKGSLLHLAARRGQEILIRLLLNHGVNVDSKDSEGSTPLHFAVSRRSPSAVRLLIERGANVDIQDKAGLTALCKTSLPDLFGASIYRGQRSVPRDAVNVECAKILLESGADPDIEYQSLMTPYLLSVYFGHLELMDIFHKYGAHVNYKVLYYAIKSHRFPAFQFLLERFHVDLKLSHTSWMHNLFLSIAEATRHSVFNDAFISLRSQFCYGDDFARHVVKAIALNQNLGPIGISVPGLWVDKEVGLDVFMNECTGEVARLKSHVFPDTNLSLHDILSRGESQVACALRNNSVAKVADSDKLKNQYPIYGSILTHHLQRGQLRKSLLEDGIKICDSRSCCFKKMPYEIKERILTYLSNRYLFLLKGVRSPTEAQP